MVRPVNIYFKVLTIEGHSLEEDYLQFSLPKGVKDGDWHSFQSELGCMLYKNPLSFYKQGYRIYVAQFDAADITTSYQEIIWVKRFRLVRQATNLDLKPFGIYRAIAQVI
jgi:hypothetical protein